MKSEPTISTQIFVSERGGIYAGSKQTIMRRAVPGQNLLKSSGDWEESNDLPVLYINLQPGQTCHSKDSGSDTFRWPVMRRNRVGGLGWQYGTR